jgi:hypothetical protein
MITVAEPMICFREEKMVQSFGLRRESKEAAFDKGKLATEPGMSHWPVKCGEGLGGNGVCSRPAAG